MFSIDVLNFRVPKLCNPVKEPEVSSLISSPNIPDKNSRWENELELNLLKLFPVRSRYFNLCNPLVVFTSSVGNSGNIRELPLTTGALDKSKNSVSSGSSEGIRSRNRLLQLTYFTKDPPSEVFLVSEQKQGEHFELEPLCHSSGVSDDAVQGIAQRMLMTTAGEINDEEIIIFWKIIFFSIKISIINAMKQITFQQFVYNESYKFVNSMLITIRTWSYLTNS